MEKLQSKSFFTFIHSHSSISSICRSCTQKRKNLSDNQMFVLLLLPMLLIGISHQQMEPNLDKGRHDGAIGDQLQFAMVNEHVKSMSNSFRRIIDGNLGPNSTFDLLSKEINKILCDEKFEIKMEKNVQKIRIILCEQLKGGKSIDEVGKNVEKTFSKSHFEMPMVDQNAIYKKITNDSYLNDQNKTKLATLMGHVYAANDQLKATLLQHFNIGAAAAGTPSTNIANKTVGIAGRNRRRRKRSWDNPTNKGICILSLIVACVAAFGCFITYYTTDPPKWTFIIGMGIVAVFCYCISLYNFVRHRRGGGTTGGDGNV